MPNLDDFVVNENKVWFTGGYWPDGVPKQLKDVENAEISSIWKSFEKAVELYDIWETDICIFVYGSHMERVKLKTLFNYAKKFGTYLNKKLGIQKGDVIAIDLPNSINFVVAYMGCQYIGAIAQGINPTYRPMELLHSLTMTNAKVFVMMDMLYIAGPKEVLPKTSVKFVIPTNFVDFLTADDETIQSLGIPSAKGKIPDETDDYKVIWMEKIIEETEPEEIELDIDPWTTPAVYLMTGGTTGLPKVAMLSHANLVANLHMIKPWTNLRPGMMTIGSIPFFHSFGMTCVMSAALSLGMQMLLFPRPPTDDVLCETINKLDPPEGIMYTGVEMLFKRLTDFVQSMGVEEFKSKYDFWKKLKYATSGAGPLHDYVRVPFEEIFCPIRVGYGLTETSPIHSVAPFWGKTKIGKLGLPMPGADWAIFDSENFDAGPICDGTKERGGFGVENTGEICVAGPHIMMGYLGTQAEQEDNLKMWNGQRWLLTGDIGFMDEDGWVEIRDRKKSLIKVSGHSVFPKEVEDLMGHHEAIDEVAVASLPDENTGEKVKAWITLKKGFKVGKNITIEEIKKWCLENMAKWKSPRLIEVVRKMPVSITGKVQRRELQEKDKAKAEQGKPIKG
ncbi:MAG: Long-chain-fatty-acid--CoA ligase [Candidatus Lokiarchaeum sp. GC14_75]|nr:MAG: Long-chain-fatty-acid--CoA ligase [Candidatus Lokiarchaeum sp. GC14_75]